jgi:hypothetical protein
MPNKPANGCASPSLSPHHPSPNSLARHHDRADAVPQPELSANFEWQPTFDELLEQTASTNVVE